MEAKKIPGWITWKKYPLMDSLVPGEPPMTTRFWPRNIGDLPGKKQVLCEWQATRLGEPHGLSIWGFPEIGPIATAQAVPPAPKRVARSAFDEGTALWMPWVLAKNSRLQHGKEGGG